MDTQQENQIKHRKESIQKQQEYNDRLAPVREQNEYNKENLGTQHKYNLEIFEKQVALTREMQEKQSKLLKNLSWRTAIVTLLAAIMGAALGMYLERNWLKQPTPMQPKQAATPIEKQNTSALPSPDKKEIIQAIKPSKQEESSSKNGSSNKSP